MIVHTPTQSLVLRARNPQQITQYIPHSKLLDYEGHNIAVRHDIDATRVLRNLGIMAPSPIRYYYQWPGRRQPMDHQIETSEFLTLHRRGFVLSGMGTGKTKAALWAADYLMREGLVHKVLVVAPLSTLELTWQQEIFDTVMHRSSVVLHGSRDRRMERLNSDADIYIVNHDGLRVIGEDIAARSDIDLWIIDEAAYLRNTETSRYKQFKNLLPEKTRLWMMTGTPCPNAPTDAWGLARIVCPERVPRYFGMFKKKTMIQVSTYKWIPRPGATEIAYEALQPGIRFRKEDCLTLPPVVTMEREVVLTKEQHSAFQDMKNQMQTALASGAVTAVNAADQITKLRQILCGVVKNTQTNQYDVMDHGPRVEVLLECIEQASAKVLVIVPFKGIVQALKTEVEKQYSCEIVNGDVSPTKRVDIFTRFKQNANPQVLLCHPKVMAHGLNLTEADMMIFYAPFHSNEETQQVLERMARPGQVNKMTIVRMGAHKLEWDIYKRVQDKNLTQEAILDMYREIATK